MIDWSPSAVIEWDPADVAMGIHPDWQARALCKKYPDIDFFPSDGYGVTVAQRICADCPVRTDCLEYALGHNEDHGVWGGASERERRRIRRVRRLR